MKMAISAQRPSLDSELDPRFGRCSYFILIDSETMEWDALENKDSAMPSGAGVGAAQFVANQGAQVVITGVVGPKASQVLQAGNIRVVTVEGGTVGEAVESFKNGTLQPAQETTSTPQAGWGQGGGGRGMGRRQGGGMGRGMGRGKGGGMGGGGGRRKTP